MIKQLLHRLFRKEEKPTLIISAKVYRASTGKWTDLGIISKGTINIKAETK